ncbi:MAG: hypothetical protein ACI3V5_03885 [Faecousia sp.]
MGIVIAAVLGLMVGVFLTALIVSGKRADERMEKLMENGGAE